MATASVTLALNQSTFLAGLARAQSSVSALGASVGRIGTRGFVVAGTAAVAFGTATAYGIKKAFDLGGRLADMSAISGRSAKNILLMKRALEDAGVSMEKIDRYLLTGQDRGKIVENALKSITAGDWADAAQSIGKQADILDANAKTFDRVSDLLGRSGDKLQGFFVGAAGAIAKAILPFLEKFDKLDFADQGAKFGAGLLLGAQALVGFFKKPELIFKTATDYFGAALMGAGNVLIAVFKTGIQFFKDGMLAAFVGIGSALAATLLESFKKPIAYMQASVEALTDTSTPNKGALEFQIKAKSAVRDVLGKNMSGELNSYGKGLQDDIDKMTSQLPKALSTEDRMNAIMKQGGPRLGFGEGQTAADFRKQASEESGKALDALSEAAGKFKVEDVLGASNALKKATIDTAQAAAVGRNMLPAEMSATGPKRRGNLTSTGGGDSEFAHRWDQPTFGMQWEPEKPTAAGLKTSKADQLLELLTDKMQKQNDITEDAWGD